MKSKAIIKAGLVFGALVLLAAGITTIVIKEHKGHRNEAWQQTIEVSGYYSVEFCSPLSGAVETNDARNVRAAFTCTFSGAMWSIFATNIATQGNGTRTPWEGLVFDGTNTYAFVPNYQEYLGGPIDSVRVSISPEPLFLRDYNEFLNIDVLWLAYGLSPNLVPTNREGTREIPLPWWGARKSALAHGFEWKIIPTADGRFVSSCEVLRNTNFDLSLGGELRRPETAFTFGAFDDQNADQSFEANLDARHSIPNGWLAATYRCTEWFSTNSVQVPKTAEELRYWYDMRTPLPNPICRAYITSQTITARQGLEPLLPILTQTTHVIDYRYRRANEKFCSPCIEYTLLPGSPWKSGDDKQLMAQADAWFLKAQMLHAKFRYAIKSHNELHWIFYIVGFLMIVGLWSMLLKKAN